MFVKAKVECIRLKPRAEKIEISFKTQDQFFDLISLKYHKKRHNVDKLLCCDVFLFYFYKSYKYLI